MKKITFAVFLLLTLFTFGCSASYKNYSQKISVSATPKEIFDIDVELRFASVTQLEKKRLKQHLAEKGLKIFTGYTRGMMQGTVITDRQFIASIRSFVEEYRKFSSSNEQAIFNEILKALKELDEFLDKKGV